jgi:hypothetical protein
VFFFVLDNLSKKFFLNIQKNQLKTVNFTGKEAVLG